MSNLGNKEIMARNIRRQMEFAGVKPKDVCAALNLPFPTFSDWINAKTYPRIDRIELLANYFGISKADLVEDAPYRLSAPAILADVVSFPVMQKLGRITEAQEIIDLPASYLDGKETEEFCAVRISGDSMYPNYQDGDIVIIEKLERPNYSGEILCVSYSEAELSLMRVEFQETASEIKLTPINPMYPPKVLESAACNIIGMPKLVIRRL